jgi:hypothetical protein
MIWKPAADGNRRRMASRCQDAGPLLIKIGRMNRERATLDALSGIRQPGPTPLTGDLLADLLSLGPQQLLEVAPETREPRRSLGYRCGHHALIAARMSASVTTTYSSEVTAAPLSSSPRVWGVVIACLSVRARPTTAT